MDTLTENERKLIELIRSLLPFEKILIEADKNGRPNNFVVTRSRKAVITDTTIIYTVA